VADLIIGVVVNILRHVAIEELQRLSIRYVAPVWVPYCGPFATLCPHWRQT
jgi:hypothetical protein